MIIEDLARAGKILDPEDLAITYLNTLPDTYSSLIQSMEPLLATSPLRTSKRRFVKRNNVSRTLRTAAAITHRRNQLWLRHTMHSLPVRRNNPVPTLLRTRLGRGRVIVNTVEKRGIGKMNVGKGSRRREP